LKSSKLNFLIEKVVKQIEVVKIEKQKKRNKEIKEISDSFKEKEMQLNERNEKMRI